MSVCCLCEWDATPAGMLLDARNMHMWTELLLPCRDSVRATSVTKIAVRAPSAITILSSACFEWILPPQLCLSELSLHDPLTGSVQTLHNLHCLEDKAQRHSLTVKQLTHPALGLQQAGPQPKTPVTFAQRTSSWTGSAQLPVCRAQIRLQCLKCLCTASCPARS